MRYKAINTDEVASAHAPFAFLVFEYCFAKALIQLPKNMEDHLIACFTTDFAFCFTVKSVLYGEKAVKINDFYFVATLYEKSKKSVPPGSHNHNR